MSSNQRENERSGDSILNGRGAILQSRRRTLEVTGLGMIVALIVAFWTFVSDGSLPIRQYLIFVSFLLVSAGGIVWRIWKGREP